MSWTLVAITDAPSEQIIGAVSQEKGKVRFMIDSGSPVTAVRPSSFSSPVTKSPSSRYYDINGGPISQKGSQKPMFTMPSGRTATVQADILDVTKDILGVANTADQRNWTIFGPSGGWIQSVAPHEPPAHLREDFVHEGNHYYLDVIEQDTRRASPSQTLAPIEEDSDDWLRPFDPEEELRQERLEHGTAADVEDPEMWIGTAPTFDPEKEQKTKAIPITPPQHVVDAHTRWNSDIAL